MVSTDNKFLVTAILAIAVFFITISTSAAQSGYNYYAEKPGSCPPPLPVQICTQACYVDGHCQGFGKCCQTSCGGTICSRPVTMRRPSTVEKPGSCPVVPTGRWVCTPTCSSDNDCPNARKCCKNRCGAMACQKPEAEIPVPTDVNVDGVDGEPPAAPNPWLVYMSRP